MLDSIHEQLGGRPVFEELADYFYAQVLLDPVLQPYFSAVNMKALRDHQAQFLGAVAGGPEYKGKPIAEAHKDLNITEEAFLRVATHLENALIHFKVPEDSRQVLLEAVAGLRGDVVGL